MAGDTDLVLERTLDAPIELVWEAYTSPEHIKRWWAPRPYATSEVEIDWRPGGIFRAVMTGHPHRNRASLESPVLAGSRCDA